MKRVLVRIIVALLALVFAARAVVVPAFAAGDIEMGEFQTRRTEALVMIGSAVLDTEVLPNQSSRPEGSKIDSGLRESVGGSVINVARQAAGLMQVVEPIVFVGDDECGARLQTWVSANLPASGVHDWLPQTRRSIIVGGTCYTVRPAVEVRELTESMRRKIGRAGLVVVAPFTVEDEWLVREVLDRASQSILQLSANQLDEPDAAIDLMKSAWLTILNEGEAEQITDEADPIDAVKSLRDRGVGNVLITSHSGVTSFIDGDWHCESAFTVGQIKTTVGAGDVFTATFAVGVLDDQPYPDAIQLGLAAAVLHVEGREPANSVAELEQLAKDRAPIPIVVPRVRGPLMAGWAQAAVSALIVLTGWFVARAAWLAEKVI